MKHVTVKVEIPEIDNVIKDLGLHRVGDVQQETTKIIKSYLDYTTPKRSGALIDDTIIGYDYILYDKPYARRLYFGIDFNFREAPQRGAYWEEKMMAIYDLDVLKDVQDYIDRRR